MTNKNNVIENVEVDDCNVSKGGDPVECLANNGNNNSKSNNNNNCENKNKNDDDYDYDGDDNNDDDYFRAGEVGSPEKVENGRNIPINMIPGKILKHIYN